MKLLNGDCLEILPSIESKSVDLVFCDLPYGQIGAKWDIPIALDKLWVELKRVLKNDHCPVIFTCTTKFGFKLIESNEKWFRYDLVFNKSTTTGHLTSGKLPMRKHEMVYIFCKKGTNYYFKDTHKRVEGELITKETNCETYTTTKTIRVKGATNFWDPPCPTTVIDSTWSGDGKRTNSTQKPQDLLKWILKYYTREGDTVLDPTMGSGSLGKACKEMKRDFIGIELREDQYKKAVEYIGN